MKRILLFLLMLMVTVPSLAMKILIPMDATQTNHLKAYGVCYAILKNGGTADWLLNYRGGSFLTDYADYIVTMCRVRNVRFEQIADAAANNILSEIARNDIDCSKIR